MRRREEVRIGATWRQERETERGSFVDGIEFRLFRWETGLSRLGLRAVTRALARGRQGVRGRERCDRGSKGQRGRWEDAILLALKMEEGDVN